MVELSIVIPAYKEAENLRLVLPQLQAALNTFPFACEILVIDSKTPLDDTKNICAANKALWCPRRESDVYGAAVREGIKCSQGKYVVFMDADGSHEPGFIAQLYARAHEADIVIASRYMQGGGTENSLMLVLLSRALNLTYACLLGIRCSDISNSFRLYNGALLRSLQLRCNHFDIVEEILVRASVQKPNLVIREIPFTFKKRLLGHSKREHLVLCASLAATLLRLTGLRLRERFKLRA